LNAYDDSKIKDANRLNVERVYVCYRDLEEKEVEYVLNTLFEW